jgi:hypothetical protein
VLEVLSTEVYNLLVATFELLRVQSRPSLGHSPSALRRTPWLLGRRGPCRCGKCVLHCE